MISEKEKIFYGFDENDNLFATGESNAQNAFQENVVHMYLIWILNTMQWNPATHIKMQYFVRTSLLL
jgi:hypothetical protein